MLHTKVEAAPEDNSHEGEPEPKRAKVGDGVTEVKTKNETTNVPVWEQALTTMTGSTSLVRAPR